MVWALRRKYKGRGRPKITLLDIVMDDIMERTGDCPGGGDVQLSYVEVYNK